MLGHVPPWCAVCLGRPVVLSLTLTPVVDDVGDCEAEEVEGQSSEQEHVSHQPSGDMGRTAAAQDGASHHLHQDAGVLLSGCYGDAADVALLAVTGPERLQDAGGLDHCGRACSATGQRPAGRMAAEEVLHQGGHHRLRHLHPRLLRHVVHCLPRAYSANPTATT